MIERFFWIIWGLWLLMVLIAACRVCGFLFAKKKQAGLWGDGSVHQKPAVIVVAVKGFDARATPRFFSALVNQNYSEYRIIISFETGRETVAQWLRDQFHLSDGDYEKWQAPRDAENITGLKSVTLISAGESIGRGQKVHNQLAALENLVSSDEVIAFADADIICPDDWLAKLTAPINQRTHDLSTTYRWLIPKRPNFPNQFASIINASITTQGGSEWSNVLWGGSMAISRKAYESLDVPVLFHGSLNDDLRLSKAAKKEGYKVAFVRSLILPTMVDFNWSGFIEFARRQYTQVKFFSPILYKCVNIALASYVFGLLSLLIAIFWFAYFPAWIPFAAAIAIDQFRAAARQRIYYSLFKEEGIRTRLNAVGWMEHMLTPVWMTLHWLIVVSTWTKRKIQWAGVTYRILSYKRTEILDRREEVYEPVPAVVASLQIPFAADVTQAIPLPPLEIPEELSRELTGLSPAPNPVDREVTTPVKPPLKKKKGKKKKAVTGGTMAVAQKSSSVTLLGSPLSTSKIPRRLPKSRFATSPARFKKKAISRKKRKFAKPKPPPLRNITVAKIVPPPQQAKPVKKGMLPAAIVPRPVKAASHSARSRSGKKKSPYFCKSIPKRKYPGLQKRRRFPRI